jgi:hypothetical protein
MKLRIAFLLLVLGAPASAHDGGQWANSPTHIRSVSGFRA